ncbi:MAG: hypothetical protein ACI9F9_001009, partial [Candidatus Paceibacteria bacterium]
MATHKAPSDVTIVTHEDRSSFAEFVDKHWLKAAALAVLATAGILFNQYQKNQDAAAVDKSWEDLMASVEEDQRGALIGDPEVLKAATATLKGTLAGPWALYFQATSLREEKRYDEAIAVLAQIKAEYPEHPLAKDTQTYGESVTPLTQIEYLSKVYTSEQKWRKESPAIFLNPEPAAGSPKARLQTDQGDILVVLDAARAPKQVENFIKLAGEGFYDGLLIHRSAYGQMIETGDPTTREVDSDALSWGQTGADDNVEKEDTGLSHFGGVLSAMMIAGTEETSGS